tara:strand:+ start:2060 stop:2683 length:624 start_codon:yes stop_codon:yes gene_type:complete
MKKLIIAPHVDDEVLGCGGVIDSQTFVVHCGLADNQNHGNNFFSKNHRLLEWETVKQEVGCNSKLLDNTVNSFQCSHLIGDLEKAINDHCPDIAYIPSPSYNQDHQEAYKACIVAFRPHDINFFVKKIVMYEQPQDFWDGARGASFKIDPNYFVPIDINKKIKLYKMLESQVRNHRSPDMLINLAKMRGHQSNCEFAEAFQILRWVD